MGEQQIRSTSSSSLPNLSSSPSAFRFLGNLKQPDPDPFPLNDITPFELDESDVVWSSDDTISTTTTTPDPISTPLPSPLIRHHHHHHHHHHPQSRFNPSNSGLSAALSDDNLHPLIRRKSNLNPSQSATKSIPQLKSASGHSIGKFHQSAPMDVPAWPYKSGEISRNQTNYLDNNFDEGEDEVDGDDEMVPPHVIVARSHVTFSVFEGVGRTLKGRDLRRVRNAVFQKTGFID